MAASFQRRSRDGSMVLVCRFDRRLVKAWCFTSLALAAVVAGRVLPFNVYQSFVLMLLAVIGGTLAISVQVRNQFLGLAALIVTAVVFPLEFGDVSRAPLNSSFFLAFFICAMWLIGVVVLRHVTPLESCRSVVAALAFMAVSIVSFAAGQFPWFPTAGAPVPVQLAQLMIFLLSAGVFLAVGHLVQRVEHLKQLTFLFLGAAAIACIIQVVPSLGFLGQWIHPESLGSLFWVWLVAVGLSQALFNQELRFPVRLALLALTALAMYRGLFIARSWASGWLPPLVALGVILLLRWPRFCAVMATIVGLVGLYFAPALITYFMAGEEYSSLTRMEATRVLLSLIEKSPLLGFGPANYYYYTRLVPILGWYVSFNSHNQYIDFLAQFGILGLITFLWFSYEGAASALRLRRFFQADFQEAYLVGAVGGLVGTLVAGGLADWIIPFYYNIGIRGFRSSMLFWLFMGGVLVLRRVARREVEVEASSSAEEEMYTVTPQAPVAVPAGASFQRMADRRSQV